MELGEKLQELRKRKGLTQEELAEALYVSRTAISKWESGRGYPSIDSLKQISGYFSVSIDDLLSGEKLLSLAETENKSNVRNLCGMLFGMVDLFAVMLILLPLYPQMEDAYVLAVNLFAYTNITVWNQTIHWTLYLALVSVGILEIAAGCANHQKTVMMISVILNVLAVLFLAMTRESYAVCVAFLLLIAKGVLLLRYVKAE